MSDVVWCCSVLFDAVWWLVLCDVVRWSPVVSGAVCGVVGCCLVVYGAVLGSLTPVSDCVYVCITVCVRQVSVALSPAL